MKKISLIILFSVIAAFTSVSAVTVGGLGIFSPNGFSATASSGKVEFELSVTELTNGILTLSADYTLNSWGIIDNLSMNVAAGAGISLSDGGFGLAIIIPVELVFKVREILNGLDIYLQAKPNVPIFPSPTFGFEIGLGVRVGL